MVATKNECVEMLNRALIDLRIVLKSTFDVCMVSFESKLNGGILVELSNGSTFEVSENRKSMKYTAGEMYRDVNEEGIAMLILRSVVSLEEFEQRDWSLTFETRGIRWTFLKVHENGVYHLS